MRFRYVVAALAMIAGWWLTHPMWLTDLRYAWTWPTIRFP